MYLLNYNSIIYSCSSINYIKHLTDNCYFVSLYLILLFSKEELKNNTKLFKHPAFPSDNQKVVKILNTFKKGKISSNLAEWPSITIKPI